MAKRSHRVNYIEELLGVGDRSRGERVLANAVQVRNGEKQGSCIPGHLHDIFGRASR
jgi:hypothetical protein